MELVTGFRGREHVTPAQWARLTEGITRSGSYVLGTQDGLAATMLSANTVRIGTGDLVVDGYHFTNEEPEDLTIESGITGQNRNDIVVCRYVLEPAVFLEDGTPLRRVQSGSLAVIKGTPTAGVAADPEHAPAHIDETTELAEVPLYRIPITGLSVGEPVPLIGHVTSFGSVALRQIHMAPIDNESDLNDFTEPGTYYFNGDNLEEGMSNVPQLYEQEGFNLYVSECKDGIWQKVVGNTSGATAFRLHADGEWLPWWYGFTEGNLAGSPLPVEYGGTGNTFGLVYGLHKLRLNVTDVNGIHAEQNGRFYVDEIGPNSTNSPNSALWWYVQTMTSTDKNYEGQLALSMTGGAQLKYRTKQANAWTAWQAIQNDISCWVCATGDADTATTMAANTITTVPLSKTAGQVGGWTFSGGGVLVPRAGWYLILGSVYVSNPTTEGKLGNAYVFAGSSEIAATAHVNPAGSLVTSPLVMSLAAGTVVYLKARSASASGKFYRGNAGTKLTLIKIY